jgi:hypothetical protein
MKLKENAVSRMHCFKDSFLDAEDRLRRQSGRNGRLQFVRTKYQACYGGIDVPDRLHIDADPSLPGGRTKDGSRKFFIMSK